MGDLPDDPQARQEWLERWAAEHRWRDESPRRIPWRSREGLARAPAALLKSSAGLAGRVLDRGLDTAEQSQEPEHLHGERTHYVPSAWHVLPRALHHLGVSDQDTFVDFGCGKGRVLHQAARRPFRRVVGVEISPVLAAAARAGLAARRRQHRCRDVEVVVADAAEFPVPDDMTIAYLFDPFAHGTLDAVLEGIVESIDRRPRRVRLIYVNPRWAAQVLATGRFRLVTEQRGGLRDARLYRAAIFESC